jgi:hypothetical protein
MKCTYTDRLYFVYEPVDLTRKQLELDLLVRVEQLIENWFGPTWRTCGKRPQPKEGEATTKNIPDSDGVSRSYTWCGTCRRWLTGA